jgi:hypothetical protein
MRARGLGHDHTFDLDTDVSRRRQHIDARVGATRMHEHFFVLLEPGVERRPLEPDVFRPVEFGPRVPQSVGAYNVGRRHVVSGIGGVLPDVQRLGGVKDQVAVAVSTDALGARLCSDTPTWC